MSLSYEGFYARFEVPSKKEGSAMQGADDLVGDFYAINLKNEDGVTLAMLSNKFAAPRGSFDEKTSRRIQLAQARGCEVRALLSFVAYSDMPEPGVYWGEMAVFCYEPSTASYIEPFIERVGEKLADGIRVKIDLGNEALQKIQSNPEWLPSKHVSLPKKEIGTAILKDHRSASEKMIEQGRARNKGCYFVSWLFIAIVIALIVFFVSLLF